MPAHAAVKVCMKYTDSESIHPSLIAEDAILPHSGLTPLGECELESPCLLEKTATCKDRRNPNTFPAGKAAENGFVSHPNRRSGMSSRAWVLCVLCGISVGFLVGVGVSLTGFVHAIGTYDYPLLSKALGRAFTYFDLSIDVDIPDKNVLSCLPDQPLVRMNENFMDPDVFVQMKKCLVGHPRISKNSLNPVGFNGTRGFVIQFANNDGENKFRHERGFNCDGFNPLLPFFDKVRDPEAQAFVMNVLVCDKPSDEKDVVVGSHVDDTLAHSKPGVTFLAHAVSVLYISVPPDMKGGALELLGSSPSDSEDGILDQVDPVENRMAQFRGDSYHQVRGYATDTDVLRISLVLEQYRVAPKFQNLIVDYLESVKDGMTMM